jgi:GT2 family glycosyltransferase
MGYFTRKLDRREVEIQNIVDMSSDHNRDRAMPRKKSKVTIIIPTRDNSQLLRNCVISVEKNSLEWNIELIVVDNNSTEVETLELLTQFQDKGISVQSYPGNFNFSAICNFAAAQATGDYLCFLNNDTSVIGAGWLNSLVDHARQDDVGLVGAVLLYPGGSIQHSGIALGFTGIAGHPYRGQAFPNDSLSYCFQVSAVTFACAVISRDKFLALGGLDETFPVGFNDVDIGVRAQNAGYKNILCTKTILTHAESQTRPKSMSFSGFRQATMDVLKYLRKHPNQSSDAFFSRE